MENLDISKVDVHALRVFLTIFRTRSVSRAAEIFDLNQSTVSHTLDKLRTSLGDPLFVRTGRGIEPTEFAHDIVPRVRDILAGLEGLIDRENYSPSVESKPVTLSINVNEMLDEVVAFRDLLQVEAPEVGLRILELGSRENVESMLDNSNADVCVSVRSPTYPATLDHLPLFSEDLVVFYDPEARGPIMDIGDYAQAPHATLDFGGARKSTVAISLDRQMVERKVAFGVANAHALARLVKGTDIITTMQARLSQSVFRDLAHCPPPVQMPQVHFDLIWHRRYTHSPRNIWIRRLVLATMRAESPVPGMASVR